ncbi:hypothetical protein San01_03760 [Streptomyces angustmyceticus]|uniref:Uncharacterized protein n=2 Tax=Streptomyces angustmyceticus TaxID=285578 RepID=A0A5J4L8S4_9ACTN|nr:hypothetical protein San01_03760 [Streptomyces angustmyceticus]
MLEVARNRPYSLGMTPAMEEAVDTLVETATETSDLVERYQGIKELEEVLDVRLREAKAEIAKTLYEGRSWRQVGDLLGVTGSRAEQISRGAR